MNASHIFAAATHFVALPQNGIITAGEGHFNALCGAIALATGKPWKLVKEVIAVWYRDEVLPTLGFSENWDHWDYQWHDFLRGGLPSKG